MPDLTVKPRNKKRKSAPEEQPQDRAVGAKKRRAGDGVGGERQGHEDDLDTSKPSALFRPRKGRDWTLSMAVPGSIIAK